MIGSSQDLGQGDESPGVLRGPADEFGDLGGHPLPLGHDSASPSARIPASSPL